MTTAVQAAERLLGRLRERGWSVGCAESLTGGLLAAAVVAVPGASAVLRGGVVAYDPEVKVDVLGVDEGLLARVGTVHPDVALAMAEGARQVLACDLALSTTGVAGPGPSEGKPAGTVCVACVGPGISEVRQLSLTGDRSAIREATVRAVLDLAHAVAASSPRGTVGQTHDDPEISGMAREGEA